LRRIALAALLLLLPAASPAQDPSRPERPVAGVVNGIDIGSGVLRVGDEEFQIPRQVFDLTTLSYGDPVTVYWQQRGTHRVATQVHHDPTAD